MQRNCGKLVATRIGAGIRSLHYSRSLGITGLLSTNRRITISGSLA
jgi:hypothetical protein